MSQSRTATMVHHDWLPNVSFETWHRVHSWTIEFTSVTLFGFTVYISKAALRERCTCLSDEEES